ncbi:MAG: hypothetical protein V1838_03120 [Patescibacteria group bacterium]
MNIAEEAKKYALEEIEKYGLPDLIHFDISEKKAIELTDKLNADKQIVQIGIYFIDLKLGQAFKENKSAEHVIMSVAATKEFLDKHKVPDDTKDKILNCVEAHHGDVPYKCKEAEICANADCYRFLHPKGFFVFLYVLAKRDSFANSLDQLEKKLEEKHKILSLDIAKQELEEYYQTLKQYINDARKL